MFRPGDRVRLRFIPSTACAVGLVREATQDGMLRVEFANRILDVCGAACDLVEAATPASDSCFAIL
jgi:hypothetical protein